MSKKIRFFYFLLFAIILGILDQIAKEIARIYLDNTSDIVLIPGFIHLTRIENSGISFGLMSYIPDTAKLIVFIILPVMVVLGLLIYIYLNFEKIPKKECIGYCLIVGGAFGNLFDRIFYSTVTDFTHFLFMNKSLFVNNLADDFISLGLFCLIIPKSWLSLKFFKKSG